MGDPPEDHNSKRAGNISRYISNWSSITNNQFILRIIREGYKIQFYNNPIFPKSVISSPVSTEKISSIQKQIDRLINFGAISAVAHDDSQILSRVFTVKKSNGDDRLIIDLSNINTQVNKVHFKMETCEKIQDIIQPLDYMASIDLSDAFFSIPLHKDSRKFISFEFNSFRYQFNVLPFGLSSSPRIFSKILKTVIIYLRNRGIKISFYLDDIFICSSKSDTLSLHVNFTLDVLKYLGFYPNYDKSNLSPTQTLVHLGFMWDSVNMKVSIPIDKHMKVVSKASFLLQNKMTLRQLSSFVGLVCSLQFAFNQAPLHYRFLQLRLIYYLKRKLDWDTVLNLDPLALQDLLWWANCKFPLAASSLTPSEPDFTLYTDASNIGWGGLLSTGESVSNLWSDDDIPKHINFLELKAVYLCITHFKESLSNKCLHIFCDNSTAISYINKRGGTRSKSLCSLALDIWEILCLYDISCTAFHVSGNCNNEADFLSRSIINTHEYHLSQCCFNKLISKITFKPNIDLFASQTNSKLNKYVSWFKDDSSFLVNAFSFSWPNNVYLFPPITLISKCIKKILHDKVENALFITPAWPGLISLPSLMSNSIDNPIFIPYEHVLGTFPTRHPFNLMAWSISCNHVEVKNFQLKLQKPFLKAYPKQLSQHISDIGCNLLNFLEQSGFQTQFV